METRLSIQGMSCAHCVATVRDALFAVAGADRVIDVDLELGRAVVTGDADADRLAAAVTAAGFPATVE